MSFINLTITIIHLIYCVALIPTILWTKSKYRYYSIKTFPISKLGTKENQKQMLFNSVLCLYGLSVLVFSISLLEVLEKTALSNIGVLLMVTSGLGTILVGRIPLDTNKLKHYLAASVAFLSGTLATASLLLPMYSINDKAQFLLPTVIPIVFFGFMFTYGGVYKIVRGKWIRYYWLYNWCLFLATILCNISLALILLQTEYF